MEKHCLKESRVWWKQAFEENSSESSIGLQMSHKPMNKNPHRTSEPYDDGKPHIQPSNDSFKWKTDSDQKMMAEEPLYIVSITFKLQNCSPKDLLNVHL